MSNLLNKTPWTIQLKSGLAANLTVSPAIYNLHEGELFYTTDTKQLYLSDGVLSFIIPKKGGSLFDHYADLGNTTTTETDLYSDTIPANILLNNGDKLVSRYAGIFVASGTATRDIRIYFAGTIIFDSTAVTSTVAASWEFRVTIIRESSTVIRASVSGSSTGASLAAYDNYTRITGLTLSNTNILKITGQAGGVGAATNDIVAKLGMVGFKPAA